MARDNSLSPDEMARIRRSLQARFKISRESNITDVGFGLPVRNGKLDRASNQCLIFSVKEKKEVPTQEDIPIPRNLSVRVKRGDKFETLSFPTDVIVLPSFRRTGRLVTHRTAAPNDCTTGIVVAWNKPGQDRLALGILTVRHALEAGAGKLVSIRINPAENGPEFIGTIRWKSRSNSAIDAAVIEVNRADLVTAQILTAGQRLTSRAPRTLAKIVNDAGLNGRSKRTDTQPTFLFQAYWLTAPPEMRSDLGPLQDVVQVCSDAIQAFKQGSSGSAWIVDVPVSEGRDLAMQIGADEATLQIGAGQALETIIIAADAGLASNGQGVAGTLRMITSF